MIILTVVVWGVSLKISGLQLTWDYLKPFSITVAIVLAILKAFDRWVWSWWPIVYFVRVPDLRGEWKVELHSTYKDATGTPAAKIEGTAVIRQTFSSLSIRMVTPSSKSVLKAERVSIEPDGDVEIYGVYQSDPSIHLRGDTSEIHYGAFHYHVIDRPPTIMEGTYWTDRVTKGAIRLVKTNK